MASRAKAALKEKKEDGVAEKDAPDDIEQDRIPREAQQAEKDYFSAMQQQNGQ